MGGRGYGGRGYGEGNPIPGEFSPRVHGSKLVYHLTSWVEALVKDDHAEASQVGVQFLHAAARDGTGQYALDELTAAMQSLQTHLGEAVTAAQAKAFGAANAGGACPPGGAATEGSADGIDWYTSNPGIFPQGAKVTTLDKSYFYVLDKKSGIELQEVLADLQHREAYVARGARPPGRLLFIGEPGNGKTAGALWLGAQLDKPVALVRIDGVIGGVAGATAKNLRACFEAAHEKGAIIVLDEFEALAVSRGNSGPNTPQWTKEVTSAVLQLFDDPKLKDMIVVACTNVPETIDKAILRRLRVHVYFSPPDRAARASMLDRWWGKAPHRPEAKRRLLDLSEGLSGDFLERAAEAANRAAARRHVEAKITITIADVEAAVRRALSGAVVPAAGLPAVSALGASGEAAPEAVKDDEVAPEAPVAVVAPVLLPR